MNHFKAIWKSTVTRKKVVHDVQQNMTAEKQEDTVNITSFNFNSIISVIIATLEIISSKISVIILFKVDTGSDGNIMPYHIFKIFPRASEEQLEANKKKKHHPKNVQENNNYTFRHVHHSN